MLTIKELYNFLHEKGIDDNCIDFLHHASDSEYAHWVAYDYDKAELLEKHGDCEVYDIDIYVKD